jgi:hypothetical protein
MGPEGTMFLIGLGWIVLALGILDALALRWGADSRDGVNSAEWERRRSWPV